MQAFTLRNFLFCPSNVLTALTFAAMSLWMPAGEIRAAGKIGQEAARFPQLYRQWEELRAQLQSLVDQSQRPASAEEFARLCALIAEAKETMKDRLPDVTDAAEAAWLENPIKDQTAFHFLNSFLHVEYVRGRHREAAEIADCLLKRSTEIPAADKRDVLLIGSQTAFDLNSFDQARRRLDGLRGIVRFTVGMNTMSERIDDYRRRWDAEQRIRARETAANDLPRVKLVTTKGQITAELFKNEAPVTTANFLRLLDEKFYDGRSIDFTNDSINRHIGFQVGANATDVGQKDNSIVRERTSPNRRDQFRGSLCMLDSGERTSGTRFMIAFIPITDIEMRFTVFGLVIDGYDVLDRLDSDQANDKNKKPEQIEKATIVRR